MYQGISAGVALGFPMAIPAVAAGIRGQSDFRYRIHESTIGKGGGGDVGGGSGSQVSGAKMMNLSGSGVNLGSLNGNIQNQMKSGMDSEMMKNEMREAIPRWGEKEQQRAVRRGIIELTGKSGNSKTIKFLKNGYV